MRAWSSHYPVPYATAHSGADEQLADAPYYGRDEETARRDGFDKIYEVCWLNVFGPKLVETVGRERMLSTPAHRVEELPNGSILLVTWPTAADFTREEARQAQARALVHLRPELDFDTVLRSLHERNAALVPVEPRFHPDVAPLLSRLVDARRHRHSASGGLPSSTPTSLPSRRSGCPRAPPCPRTCRTPRRRWSTTRCWPSTWWPCGTPRCPPSSSRPPSPSPTWTSSSGSRTSPNLRAPAHRPARGARVGAYLGEVLVRHLGGQWIPRKKLEEAQVRVGQRVWLPFVRAHKYMRSRQSLLDFSLTQLYRVAERYRG